MGARIPRELGETSQHSLQRQFVPDPTILSGCVAKKVLILTCFFLLSSFFVRMVQSFVYHSAFIIFR